MKLNYNPSQKTVDQAFAMRQDRIPCIEQNWHYHPEVELIFFKKSSGTRYVGNSIGNFEEGELYLIGSGLPHLFRNDRDYYLDENNEMMVDLIVIKFLPEYLGKEFNHLYEYQDVMRLLMNANRGLKFVNRDVYLVSNLLSGLLGASGLTRIIELLRVLNILAQSTEYEVLCHDRIIDVYNKDEKDRMSSIIKFLTDNFDKTIKLKEVSDIAHMTPNSFCRFFKKRTQKSFSEYLTEIRIRNACQMLIKGEHTISEVCYQSGFNTITNFNRQFKGIKGMTPSEFTKQYQLAPESVFA